MIRAWSRVYAKSFFPFMRREENPRRFRPLKTVIPAPDNALVTAYTEWCGATGRYARDIPPHMFCQWGLPLVLSVIEQSRYDVTGIINQGLCMRVFGELPRDQELVACAELESMEESHGRANLKVKVVTGTRSQPRLVEALLHSTFILSANPGRSGMNRSIKPALDASWESAGSWRAEPDDGFQFALLTGDFNPIHWVESAGKKSPFGSTVLQGFGAFARSYERLSAVRPLREIEVQFQRPVLLPSSELNVEFARTESDWSVLRLFDGNRRVRLSGRFR